MTAEEFTSDPGAQAAADAVLAARRSGRSGSAAMLDALEAAEGTYERQHEARKLQAQAHGLQGPALQAAASHGQAGGAVAVQVPPGAPQAAGPGQWGAAGNERAPDTPRKAAICEGTREKMVQAVFEALQANPRWVLPGVPLGQRANGLPEACGRLPAASAKHSWLGCPATGWAVPAYGPGQHGEAAGLRLRCLAVVALHRQVGDRLMGRASRPRRSVPGAACRARTADLPSARWPLHTHTRHDQPAPPPFHRQVQC